MKTHLKFVALLILIMIAGCSMSCGVFMAEEITPQSNENMSTTEILEINNNISEIEKELGKRGTSIIAELEKQKESYKRYLLTCDEKEIAKIEGLIKTTEEIIDEYVQYQNRDRMRGKYHVTYSPLVAAAISYFNVNKCKLAAELLTHAKENETYLSSYSPININDIEKTETFITMSQGDEISGHGIYEKSESEDLYYALRRFSYKKAKTNSRTVTIEDVYDFAPNNGDGFEGTVLDSMYKAQENGVIVPFNVTIKINPTSKVELYENNYEYYGEEFYLEKGEKRNFEVYIGTATYWYFYMTDVDYNAYIKVTKAINGEEITKVLMTSTMKSVTIEWEEINIGITTYIVEIGFINIFNEGNIFFEASKEIILNN